MPVTKDLCERYSVRDAKHGQEWATITLRCWERLANVGTKHEGIYYCGEIMIHSTFGSWANTWTACAQPFKEFLIGAEFEYVFGKFMGHALHRFDGEASVAAMFERIVGERKAGGLSKHEARQAWDLLDEVRSAAEGGERDFGDAMHCVARELDRGHPMRNDFADPCGWPSIKRHDRQAVGFWKQIWPEFEAALRAEVAQPIPQAA